MRGFLRTGISLLILMSVWQAMIVLFQLPSYVLPSPLEVLSALLHQFPLIMQQSIPTFIETLAGLVLGILAGATTALAMVFIRHIALWFFPLLIASQAIPTFAIAPLLVIWFGYGMSSKIVTATIMIFFPVTSAFYDGLRKTPTSWLDLAKTMNAKKWRTLWYLRIPAALPTFASGVRVATVIAPIGAIVGEWVGASQGLGFLMLSANARMQIDLMFAVLVVIILFSLCLFYLVDKVLSTWITW